MTIGSITTKAVEAMLLDNISVLDVKIGRSIRVAEAAERGKSIITYDLKNPQTENYWKLAASIEEWVKNAK